MLMLLAVMMITIVVLQRRSRKQAIEGLEYSGRCSKQLVEQEETFEYVGVVTNYSNRLLSFLRMEELFPSSVKIAHQGGKLGTDLEGNFQYISTTYIKARSQMTRRVTLSLNQRGCHHFVGAKLQVGDFLGLREKRKSFPMDQEVVVYPKRLDIGKIREALGGFLGEVSVQRFIMEDPVLTVGARDYTGSEPLNSISWKHSARTGKMMVKQFDYTAEPMVTVVLDINITGADTSELVEHCFSIVRGVGEQLERQKISYDFMFNAFLKGDFARERYLPEGLGPHHFSLILEVLGRATHQPEEDFSKTIDRLKAIHKGNRSIIVVLPRRDRQKEKLANEMGGLLTFIYGEDFYEADQQLKDVV